MERSSNGSEFVRHVPCPACGSSDANSLYDDGHTYCFACETLTHGDAPEQAPSKGPGAFSLQGEIQGLRARRITEETCKKFNVRVYNGKQYFPYYTESRQVCGAKEKGPDKTFAFRGSNPDKQLFGQQLFGGGKKVVVTEGEVDALSVWEANPGWPVVSIPNGASAAKKALAQQLPWLLGFKEIVLFFDSDEPGQKAAQECAGLFPPDRVFTAFLGAHKDASEALVAGDRTAIRDAIWKARPYSPRSILDGTQLYDLMHQSLGESDASYPWPKLNEMTSGIRRGELVTFTAGSGVGKSTALGEIAQHLIRSGKTIGYIALEESVQRTGLRLMTVEANRPLHLDNALPEDEFRAAFDASVGSGRCFLRDGFGSVDPDEILNDIRFLVKARDVEYVVLDHLSILLSGLDGGDDERKLIDRTMTKLRSFVEETKIGMFLICHLSRGSGDKGHEDGAQVSLRHLRGSHSITQLSDLVVALERNLSAGDNESSVRVLKSRYTGVTGLADTLIYDKATGRMKPGAPSTEPPTLEEYGQDF